MRARLAERAHGWRRSSVRAHPEGRDDALVRVAPVLARYGRFADFLGEDRDDEAAWRRLRLSETSGRPLGSDAWRKALEAKTGRTLKPKKRGPKPKRELRAFGKVAP